MPFTIPLWAVTLSHPSGCTIDRVLIICRPPLPAQHPITTGFEKAAPVLLIGSQAWNDASVESSTRSDKEKEAAVLRAASRCSSHLVPLVFGEGICVSSEGPQVEWGRGRICPHLCFDHYPE